MAPGQNKVQLEILFSAPIEKVWRAWTEPGQVVKWFGSDPNGHGLKSILDVRAGGFFEISFQDGDQTMHTCFGTYSEVRPFTNLEFTWNWRNEPGVESLVILEFASEGDFTRMLFRHEQLGKDSQHNYEIGWKATFLKLQGLLN